MLSEAVAEIHRANEFAAARRRRLQERREAIERLDAWMLQIEGMLERDTQTVPEGLVVEISNFVQRIDPKLGQSLMRNQSRRASGVLDVLFDAQEAVLPRAAAG